MRSLCKLKCSIFFKLLHKKLINLRVSLKKKKTLFFCAIANMHSKPLFCDCMSPHMFQPSYDHIIAKFKLFLVQIQLEMADLQNHWGSRGSWYVKRISWVQRWILNNKIVPEWGRLDSPGGTSFDVVFKADTLAYLSAMDYLF